MGWPAAEAWKKTIIVDDHDFMKARGSTQKFTLPAKKKCVCFMKATDPNEGWMTLQGIKLVLQLRPQNRSWWPEFHRNHDSLQHVCACS